MITQYQLVTLRRDLNPVIKAGMVGVVIELWEEVMFEVEFVKGDGTNYQYDGKSTFTLGSDAFTKV
jgi:hypothetical protein